MKGIVFEKFSRCWMRLSGKYHKWEVEEMTDHYNHPFRWFATEEEASRFEDHYAEKGIEVIP